MFRIVVVFMIVGLCVHTAAALPGSGTQQDPWRIESLSDFDEFAADPNYWAGFTRLETDVNLAGRTYSTAVIAPDTNNASSWQFDGTAFTGVFDGNAHKIVWLTIDDSGAGNWYLGLFGYIEYGEVRNLRLEGGSISGESFVGGLVGLNDGGNVSNCFSNGDVNGVGDVGVLVGRNEGSISNCYSTGNVAGDNYIGGLVGGNGGSVSNCYSIGDVNGYDSVGGLVGNNYYLGSISNCYSTGDVNGQTDVGGLLGGNGGSISNCYSTGDVSGYKYVGGLVGANGYWRSPGGPITNCHSTGDVSGDGGVGGLVGSNGDTLLNCYSTGDVNGVDYVGGLVGTNDYGIVSNCYSIGDVSGSKDVGGLVGQNGIPMRSYGIVSNCYSTGDVNGVDDVGGLVGDIYEGYIEWSFWDVETSGEPNMCGTGGATGCDPNCGKTTAEMQTKSTFIDAGWDFIEIWGIGENQTYPYIRFAPAGDFNYDKKVDLFDLAIFADHWLEEK